MSRIGKLPITLPDKTTMTVAEGSVTVKGPKGELTQTLHPHVSVTVADGAAMVSVKRPDDRKDRALWGLSRTLIANMVIGVNEGFKKVLEINGVGYKVALSGKKLVFNLGYSHPIDFSLPEGITATVDKETITLEGTDKQLVGAVAADIRSLRPPEPYKGKGIKYAEEIIRRKAGKVVKAAEG